MLPVTQSGGVASKPTVWIKGRYSPISPTTATGPGAASPSQISASSCRCSLVRRTTWPLRGPVGTRQYFGDGRWIGRVHADRPFKNDREPGVPTSQNGLTSGQSWTTLGPCSLASHCDGILIVHLPRSSMMNLANFRRGLELYGSA